MSRHRLEPPPRVRPRYGRIGAAGAAFSVTLFALLAGVGIIPVGSHPAAYAGRQHATGQGAARVAAMTSAARSATVQTPAGPTVTPAARKVETELPADSGVGKRIVFDMSDQRVWLVNASDVVARTYLVSGSLTDNLQAGTYHVYSKSRWAVGIDESGVMQYFVRFTHGKNAPIGFHSIPTKNGKLLETRAQLGTPQSHGCIRQYLPDAIRLWDFAPIGTKVVVTA